MGIELIAGLGNPGPRYADTRHNLGFRVVDLLASRWDARWCDGPATATAVAEGRPVLVKPLTFMNRSGRGVAAAMATHRVEPEAVLVVVDDVDLPLGRLRLRPSGGPGTHNGMRDLCDVLGTGFARLRLGVRGDEPWDDLASYVLERFPPAEAEIAAETVVVAADAVETVCRDGVERAMNEVNRRGTPEVEGPDRD